MLHNCKLKLKLNSYEYGIDAFAGIQVQALPFVRAAFLNHLQPVLQKGSAVAKLIVSI